MPPESETIESGWRAVHRVDLEAGKLLDRRRTQQGGLIARANLTRTGVFEYRDANGGVRRELRHPDDVFEPESLATLEHATYTDDHPDKVHPGNFRQVVRGHVVGVHRDGKFVSGEIHIQDADGIQKAEKGDLQENSCGYECLLDPTPGEYEGQKYDARQRRIRYNHVAGGPPGWGRAGPEVRMHLDSKNGDSFAVSMPADGATYVPGMPTVEELQRQLDAEKARADREKTRADAAEKQAGELTKKVDALDGKVAALEARTDAADKNAKAASDQARLDAYVDESIGLIMAAHRHLDTREEEWSRKREDGKSKSNKEIQAELLAHLRPQMSLEGRSDAWIAAACEVALEDGLRADTELDELAGVTGGLYLDDPQPRRGRRDARAAGSRSGSRGGDDDEPGEDNYDTGRAQARMLDRMKTRFSDSRRAPGAARDSMRAVPMRSALGAGEHGNTGQFEGGFGGGMGG